MTRRAFLGTSIALAATGNKLQAAATSPFGVCIYSYGAGRKFTDTLEFLDHCHALNAAGIQMPLTSLDPAYAAKVKAQTAAYGMYYEGITSLPKGDTVKFEQTVVAAKAAGATLLRTACLGSRRYETFSDMAQWQQFVRDSHASLAMAIPVLEKHRMALAVENHKDWTIDEMLGVLQQHQSEYLGVCLDFGNNIALLDEPDAVLKLAPYAISSHVKDIAVTADPQGFRMTEVPLGHGVVDVHRFITTIRAARPSVRFSLEMITRDPLLIPCLADKYWATFPDRKTVALPRALAMVQQRGVKELPAVSSQPPAAQTQLADDNVRACLHYADALPDLFRTGA